MEKAAAAPPDHLDSDAALDTIAAIATGAGRAGIGIIRVSGPDVPRIAQQMVGQSLDPRKAHYGPFLGEFAEPIDFGIAIRFDAPDSFTGEHVLELQGHGGAVILDLLLQRVLELGVRPARPGEFSERAFLNDKLDLAQAEAVADLIDSGSASAARAAVRSLSGAFSKDTGEILEELVSMRVWLEAALDFSEEEIDFLADPELAARADRLISRFDTLLSKSEQGQRLRDGLTLVIAGCTNVGKSSLLNALSGSDSAIVTEVAGTTRDVLHEHITLEGVPLHLVDTAGVRLTDDIVEQEGIERTRRAVSSADHVLMLVDVTTLEFPEVDLPDGVPVTVLINKIDLGEQDFRADRSVTDDIPEQPIDDQPVVSADHVRKLERLHSLTSSPIRFVSVKSGQGMEPLRDHLLSLAGHDSSIEGVYLARRRHLDALAEARAATIAALARLTEGVMPELAAEELRLAQQALDRITGRFDTEDLLGRIFSDFCVGK